MLAVLPVGIGGLNAPAMAGNGVKIITKGKTVTTRLTGTKKHNVKYTNKTFYTNGYERSNFSLYIDGKVVYTYKSAYLEAPCEADVWLLEINNTTTLICVNIEGTDEPQSYELKIFSYSVNKLRMCGDIHKLMGIRWRYFAGPIQAGNNKIIISWTGQESSIGFYDETASFNYSSSKNQVTRTSTINKVSLYSDFGWYDNWGTVIRSFNTYTKAGGNTLSFTARIGDYLRVQRVTRVNGAIYFEVKNTQGKVGWYKDKNKWDYDSNYDPDYLVTGTYFREAHYGC